MDRCSICKSLSVRTCSPGILCSSYISLKKFTQVTLGPEVTVTIRARPDKPPLASTPWSTYHTVGSGKGSKAKRALAELAQTASVLTVLAQTTPAPVPAASKPAPQSLKLAPTPARKWDSNSCSQTKIKHDSKTKGKSQ